MFFSLRCSRQAGIHPQTFDVLLAKLPHTMHSAILRYKRAEDRDKGLLGKLLLAKGLQHLGYPPAQWLPQITRNAFDRPSLPLPLDFNISHSGDQIICVFNTDGRIGADIEFMRPVNLHHFRNIMRDDEWFGIMEAPQPLFAFYTFWTRKEAAIKAHGHGLNLPLKEIFLFDDHVRMENRDWYLYPLPGPDQYQAHVVSDKPLEIRQITCQEIPITDFFTDF
jgi:4'-phosphopantetheinyl transferase